MIKDYLEQLSKKVNGYELIDSLSNTQIDILCEIASSISNKKYLGRFGLKAFTLEHGAFNSVIFDSYIMNVKIATTKLMNA